MALIICGGLLVALGVFMIAMPKASVKKGVEVTPEIIKQVRQSGIVELILGVALLIVGFIFG